MPFSLRYAMRRSVSFQLLQGGQPGTQLGSQPGQTRQGSSRCAPVAAVDDDVSGRQVGDDLLNELVHNLSSLDHQLNAAGLLQIGDHFFDGVAADNGFAFGAALQKLVHLQRKRRKITMGNSSRG